MKKKISKILIVFLILLSISAICYAGFVEVDYNDVPTMDSIEKIELFFKYIFENLIESYLGYSSYLPVKLEPYILLGIILLYVGLSLLIIKKKKELFKLMTKINFIIFLVVFIYTTQFCCENSRNIVLETLILLIISLVFQKVISKRSDIAIKRSDFIAKIIVLILLMIEIIVLVRSYNIIFTNEQNIEDKDEIIVEVITKWHSPWSKESYCNEIYTISSGESIVGANEYVPYNKVTNIHSDGCSVEYIDINYYPNDENSENYFSKKYNSVSEKKEMKMKWNTWYKCKKSLQPNIAYDGGAFIYIRLNKN